MDQSPHAVTRRAILTVVAVYLLLSGVEAARLLMISGAPAPDLGFFGWENEADGGVVRRFRWTTGHARARRLIDGAVLEVPFFMARPGIERQNATVTLRLGGEHLDEIVIDRNGWLRRSYYVPPVIGRAVTAPGAASPPASQGWKELSPWRKGEIGAPTLDIEVTPTFVPAEITASPDHRELGVGVGTIGWTSELPIAGVGFHPPESLPDGGTFRWTSRLWASQPLTVAGTTLSLTLRADHPDMDRRPIAVRLFWNEKLVKSVTLTDHRWHPVAIVPGRERGTAGVLSLHVDRTWSPASVGRGDTRRLGVAVSEPAWR